MFTFWLQLKEWFSGGPGSFFVVFFVFAWAVWLAKAFMSRKYRPHTGDFNGTVSVVIPVVNEDPAFFADVLWRIAAQADDVLVVINGPRNVQLEQVCADFDVEYAWNSVASKRQAIVRGFEETTGEIVVLVDSDTLWDDKALVELVRPFTEDRVGGVTTHQSIYRPDRSFWTRLADYLEGIRSTWGSPAYSAAGTVGCLPGRTIAFRRSVITPYLHRFLVEKFLGVHLEISDDRTLTNYVLIEGYDTVYQSTSMVQTDAPEGFKKWLRQQYRWAKGSQYNTLRMLPFMLVRRKFWLLSLNYIADIIIPIALTAVWFDAIWSWLTNQQTALRGVPLWLAVLAGAAGIFFGTALRNLPYLKHHRQDFVLLVPFMLVLTFVMPFIRIWGLMRMGYDEGWGTRSEGFQGRRSRSLWRFVPLLGTPALMAGLYATVIAMFH